VSGRGGGLVGSGGRAVGDDKIRTFITLSRCALDAFSQVHEIKKEGDRRRLPSLTAPP
jgi:hypothetical protein